MRLFNIHHLIRSQLLERNATGLAVNSVYKSPWPLNILFIVGFSHACTTPMTLPEPSTSETPLKPQSGPALDVTDDGFDQRVFIESNDDQGVSQELDLSVALDRSVVAPEAMLDMRPDAVLDPCLDVTCGDHGACVATAQSARCECEPNYEARGLSCEPEDYDGDGVPFITDCDDRDSDVYPNAPERCDQVDQDCDQEVDEGSCSIWVLEPRSSEWSAYALDVSGGQNLPQGPIKAAWDIESLGLGFVLTETGFHELRLSTLAWGARQPLNDLFTGHGGAVSDGAFAYSVAAAHSDAPFETVTLNLVAPSGVKRVWLLKYILSERSFQRYAPTVVYGDSHSWDDPNAPPSTEIRAAWLDVTNDRGWSSANPRVLCDANADASDPYTGIITESYLYLMENGYCFVFSEPTPLVSSPLDLPGAPRFDEVGGAFWHQGALYLFRGD